MKIMFSFRVKFLARQALPLTLFLLVLITVPLRPSAFITFGCIALAGSLSGDRSIQSHRS